LKLHFRNSYEIVCSRSAKKSGSPAADRNGLLDHVHHAVAERRHVEIPIRPGDDVGHDSEVAACQQAGALAYAKFVIVVVEAVLQLPVGKSEVLALLVELEFEQVTFVEKCARSSDKQIPRVVPSKVANSSVLGADLPPDEITNPWVSFVAMPVGFAFVPALAPGIVTLKPLPVEITLPVPS
jgi:hypothetical protein